MRCLRHKRYFIVLDDIWTPEAWEELKVGFPSNKKGSKILVTTQSTLVARQANLNRTPYYLRFLNDSESWELLEKRVFGKAKCPKELRESGELIARECRGLPLTIVIISRTLLAKCNMKSCWEKVDERVHAFVLADEKRLIELVAERYRSLPYNVQLCFLYCGLIPRGPISVSKLIRLWIAEGFIRDELGLGLENVARSCLDELVDRSLLFAISRRPNGEIRACEIHDILRDFCRREAEVQGLYNNINKSNGGLSSNCRRMCVDADSLKSVLLNSFDDRISTILTFSEGTIISERKETKMLRALKKIRIMEASCIKFLEFPKELRKLVLLRYLAFSCDINSIPKSISDLWSLQTLIIVTSLSVIHFPKDIWKLYQLRHLETNASALLPVPPESISTIGQENMQTLSTIAPESCTKEVFSRVPDVNKLGIRGELDSILSPESQLIDNFERLEQLTNLKLIKGLTSSSVVQNLSAKLSKVVARLTKLTISGTSLGWESMTILGELEMLEVLKVRNNAFIGDQWSGNQGIFPSLILLSIDTTELKTWDVSNNQFIKLTSLLLKNCENLQAITTLLADLPSFQNLDVHNCCTSVLQSAREIHSKGATWKLSIYPPDM